ncbi:MAG TPA: phosphate acyltransferase, partial [Bacillota bacterium]|nr:phosphate acyltransferase [Bacillota bacterium]
MSNLFEQLKGKVSGKNKRIVFPEGLDERILAAAGRLSKENVVQPILIGNKEEIAKRAEQAGADVSQCD